jgi:predicted permease
VRRLIHDWRFTASAVLILGLGVGANTAIFSLVNTVLFRTQPGVQADGLVNIYQNVGEEGRPEANSYPAYLDMAAYTDVFAGTAAASFPTGVDYKADGGVRTALGAFTTSTYLSVIGLRPSLGRWFDASEETPGAEIVAVLGHQTWRTRFGASPSVIGRTIRVNGAPVIIIGVAPEGHNNSFNAGIVTDFWLPISSIATLGGPPRILQRRPDEMGFLVKARLRDGVTVAQARAAMDGLGKRLAAEYPAEDPGRGISVFAAADVRVHPQADPVLAAGGSVLLIVVALVLAIACSNLATLLLVRGASRAKEVSVRLALGATRGQIVRHLMAESLLVALAGGVAGCLLAWWAVNALGAINLPIIVDLTLDYRVFAFALAASLASGLAFGLAPALRATRPDVLPSLKEEGDGVSPDHRWLSLKNALIVFQVVVSFVLLAGTGLFVRMLIEMRTQDLGYAIDGVAYLQTDARYAGYTPAQATAVYEDLRRRVAAVPGVESAVLSRGLPMGTTGFTLVVDGADAAAGPIVNLSSIWAGPGYFETLRIPILHGRGFDQTDRRQTPRVAVINETMARRHFGTVYAVGRRFRYENDANSWLEVVGVARDTGTADLDEPLPQPLFYVAFSQSDQPPTTVLARTSLGAPGLLSAMQRELRAIDPALPVIAAATMEQRLQDSLYGLRVATTFMGGLGALGLSLASVGLYAIVAFSVSRRSREVGIRMALGARKQQVVWVVARDVAILVGIGTAVGLALSVIGIQAIRAGVGPTPANLLFRPSVDPVALLLIAALMGATAFVAAWLPARRAAKMDPLVALRHS